MAAVLDGEGLSCSLLLDEPQDQIDAEIRRPGVHIVVAPWTAEASSPPRSSPSSPSRT